MKKMILVVLIAFCFVVGHVYSFDFHWKEVLKYPWGCTVDEFITSMNSMNRNVKHEHRAGDRYADAYLFEYTNSRAFVQFNFNKNGQLCSVFHLFDGEPDDYFYGFVTGTYAIDFGRPSVANLPGSQLVIYNTDEYNILITATLTGWSISIRNKRYG